MEVLASGDEEIRFDPEGTTFYSKKGHDPRIFETRDRHRFFRKVFCKDFLLGVVVHVVSLAMTPLLHCGLKATTDHP